MKRVACCPRDENIAQTRIKGRAGQKARRKPGMVVHSYNPNTQEAEAGRL
jgi:hypothetical protein